MNFMKNNDNFLYTKIMKNVSKEVKKVINEAIEPHDNLEGLRKLKAALYESKTINENKKNIVGLKKLKKELFG